jgi:hypothetical protein
MPEGDRDRLRKRLDTQKENVERAKRMTPEELAKAMAEHNRKKKERELKAAGSGGITL